MGQPNDPPDGKPLLCLSHNDLGIVASIITSYLAYLQWGTPTTPKRDAEIAILKNIKGRLAFVLMQPEGYIPLTTQEIQALANALRGFVTLTIRIVAPSRERDETLAQIGALRHHLLRMLAVGLISPALWLWCGGILTLTHRVRPRVISYTLTARQLRRSRRRMRRIAILAEGMFEWHYGKTATGVIRYGQDPVVAVIDSTKAGQDVAQALGAALGVGIPVVRDIHEALRHEPDTLLIGIAPQGGVLPAAWRWQLLTAIAAGLNVVSGLHSFLADDPELQAAAAQHAVTIWDVRRPPARQRVAEFVPHRQGSYTVLMVGSDCATGKMSTALELNQEATRRGYKSAFAATGQTGIMISNNGLPVDRIISDFVAGMVEEMVLDFTNRHDWVFVEGQGALNHPGYSPVTLGLIHGSMPDAMIFSHKVGTTAIEGYDNCPFPSLRRMIQMNEDTVSWVRPNSPCKVVGIYLVTQGLSDEQAREAVKQIEDETGLPTTDVWRFGVHVLLDALNGC